jgi:hypothetical protein
MPSLITWYGDVALDCDDPVFMYGELNLVALADVKCLPDGVRQSELRLRAKPCPSFDLRAWFSLGTSLFQG